MPISALRPCTYPGCDELVRHGRCTRHQLDARRPSAARRGYDSAWRKIRLLKLSRDPYCEDAEHFGARVPAAEVDHIIPLAEGGTHDWSNLQSLCKSHHSRKTRAQNLERMRG